MLISEYLFLFGFILLFGSIAIHLENLHQIAKVEKARQAYIEKLLKESNKKRV